MWRKVKRRSRCPPNIRFLFKGNKWEIFSLCESSWRCKLVNGEKDVKSDVSPGCKHLYNKAGRKHVRKQCQFCLVFVGLFSRSELIILLRAKRACSTWTASCLSQMQNSVRHKSLYEYMLGVRQWHHVAVRHGAFCVSRQRRLRRWLPAHFMCYSWNGHVYSSNI